MRKRKSPIAKSLLNNSVSAMISTIELHNKPEIKYRYETVVILLLNSWELALKSYLYKNHKKDVRIFEKDGRTKPFENCLNITGLKLGKDFNPIKENLDVLYNYRNQVAHFYLDEINPILFSLVSKSIIFYSKFINDNFGIDLTETSDLILLPIGFKRPISPIDYISNTSVNKNTSKEVKDFLKTIIVATENLHNQDIDEAIFVEFKMNLTNVSRIKNADLIAGIDNSSKATLTINTKPINKIKIGSDGQPLFLTNDKSTANALLVHEELQDNIFEEINNILDANRILGKNSNKFLLGTSVYYRIYSERDYVNYTISDFEMLAKYGAIDTYSPFIFWLTKLPALKIAEIFTQLIENPKHPNISSIIKLSFIFQNRIPDILKEYFDNKYKDFKQKPQFCYTFNDIYNSKQKNPFLKAFKIAFSKKFFQNKTFKEWKSDEVILHKNLSDLCLKTFIENRNENKTEIRDLDFILYSDKFTDIEEIAKELENKLLL